MRVLVVGQGGREHAIVEALTRDPSVDEIVAAPGNPGIAASARCLPDVAATDVQGVAAAADGFDLVVVGPEAPLVAGLADLLEARGVPVFGPNASAARLEGSKAWTKDLLERHGIPAAGSRSFTASGDALSYLEGLAPPFVVKADGLAAGKGVVIAEDLTEAERAIRACLDQDAFGEAGRTVLVEEFLDGRELSLLAITDGTTQTYLEPAQDHKRLGDGDEGPNTGGMGAYSPVPFLSMAAKNQVVTEVFVPLGRALAAEGIHYVGVLYAGLMLTADGPRVLEFNCRFGDPEAQAILPRLRTPLGRTLAAAADGRLGDEPPALDWTDEACVTVVMASPGYPDAPRTGEPIEGLAEAAAFPGVSVFHAGTSASRGRILTAGGRVLAVTALGDGLDDARGRAYEAVARIRFDGMQYRRDIAALDRTGAMDG
jgi:phosphoribosylamine--glycine ligase